MVSLCLSLTPGTLLIEPKPQEPTKHQYASIIILWRVLYCTFSVLQLIILSGMTGMQQHQLISCVNMVLQVYYWLSSHLLCSQMSLFLGLPLCSMSTAWLFVHSYINIVNLINHYIISLGSHWRNPIALAFAWHCNWVSLYQPPI